MFSSRLSAGRDSPTRTGPGSGLRRGYFALPLAWPVVGGLIPALVGPARWLDLSITSSPLANGSPHAGDWVPLLTSVAVWVGVPMVIGYGRWIRREVS